MTTLFARWRYFLGCGLCGAMGLGAWAAAFPVPTNRVDLSPGNNRKALMMGYGQAPGQREPTHANAARNLFLRLVGNPANDPAKGWTCDFTWDLMVRLGMDPTNTPAETLFQYIGQHRLGYRIAMNCGPFGMTSGYWIAAVENGIMPFAPQGNNTTEYIDDPVGLRAAVGVAGGGPENRTTRGPGVEFLDLLPAAIWEGDHDSPAQSWANQVVAARFARILDRHPNYNIWDARQHLRQAASFWNAGWNPTNGYGRVNETVEVGELLPAPPVDFQAQLSRDRHRVNFSWRNFRQTGFAATVIARPDGRVLYRGTGTNLVWTSDTNGRATFVYWSENQQGRKSRLESYQTRTLTGLGSGPYQTCLVLAAPSGDDSLGYRLAQGFHQTATNWVCDMIYRPGNPFYDRLKSFPAGPVVAVLPDFPAMVSYAVTNHYRILLAPAIQAEGDLYRHKTAWDRAADAGLLVVLPHHASISRSRKPQARRLSPPTLFSAITVGFGVTNNTLSFGPGLEFFDAPASLPTGRHTDQMDAAAVVAGKLARILDAYPYYNSWDARQHLRQSASHYVTGWIEDGGYGRPPSTPTAVEQLDPAPPLEIQAEASPDGQTVRFAWRNFMQTSFAETIIQREDHRVLYHGTGTNFAWNRDHKGAEAFRFFSRDKTGRLSREETYTQVRVPGVSLPKP